jgi:hypothetical protein
VKLVVSRTSHADTAYGCETRIEHGVEVSDDRLDEFLKGCREWSRTVDGAGGSVFLYESTDVGTPSRAVWKDVYIVGYSHGEVVPA